MTTVGKRFGYVVVVAWAAMLIVVAPTALAQSTSATESRSTAKTVSELLPREPTAARQKAWRRLQLASAYFEQGQSDVALQEVGAALRIDPTDPQAFNLLGLIHQQRGASELAAQSFQQALRLAAAEKNNATLLASVSHNYGWFLCEQANFAQGQSALRQALQMSDHDPNRSLRTWLVLGDCQQRAGLTEQAQQSWRQALAIEPHNPWLHKRLNASAAFAPSVE
jgi:type IV pilus assembly protein PilF